MPHVAIIKANRTINGVKYLANCDMKVSVFPLLLAAFSTKSIILEIIESRYGRNTFTSIICPIFILPLKIVSPTSTDLNKLSPVKFLVSILVLPLTITPSAGTISPLLTIIISPGKRLSTFTSVISKSNFIFALPVSGITNW